MATVSDDTDLTLYVTFFLHLVRNAKPLNVAACSSELKRILYEISSTSFSSQRARASSSNFYNLIKPYLGKNTYYLSFQVFLCLS